MQTRYTLVDKAGDPVILTPADEGLLPTSGRIKEITVDSTTVWITIEVDIPGAEGDD